MSARDVWSSAGWVIGALTGLLLATFPVRAEPTVVGKLNVKHENTAMTGEVRFDLSGGPVTGHADLTVASSDRSPPKRKAGGVAPGRFQVRIELEGTYAGGSFGAMKGTARVSGTFTDEANCQAKVHGTGTFTGSQSGPLGTAEIQCVWKQVEFEGCEVASPQPFSAALQYTFEPTNAVPKLHIDPGAADSSSAAPTDSERVPAATGSNLGWWIMGASAVLVAIGIGGLVVARRMRTARR